MKGCERGKRLKDVKRSLNKVRVKRVKATTCGELKTGTRHLRKIPDFYMGSLMGKLWKNRIVSTQVISPIQNSCKISQYCAWHSIVTYSHDVIKKTHSPGGSAWGQNDYDASAT